MVGGWFIVLVVCLLFCCFNLAIAGYLWVLGLWLCWGWLPLFRVLRVFVIVVDLVVILFVCHWRVGLVMVVSCCFGLL